MNNSTLLIRYALYDPSRGVYVKGYDRNGFIWSKNKPRTWSGRGYIATYLKYCGKSIDQAKELLIVKFESSPSYDSTVIELLQKSDENRQKRRERYLRRLNKYYLATTSTNNEKTTNT